MSEENECPRPGEFSWNELIAADETAQKKFYTNLFGWQAEPFGGGEKPYTLFKQGGTMVAGMMQCPQPGSPSHWLAYVTVADVDATADTAKKLGAQIVVAPLDIPEVGRIAVLVDPHGAAIGLFKPQM
jgi:predicted enzyme related to lactoylglutathione lyase